MDHPPLRPSSTGTGPPLSPRVAPDVAPGAPPAQGARALAGTSGTGLPDRSTLQDPAPQPPLPCKRKAEHQRVPGGPGQDLKSKCARTTPSSSSPGARPLDAAALTRDALRPGALLDLPEDTLAPALRKRDLLWTLDLLKMTPAQHRQALAIALDPADLRALPAQHQATALALRLQAQKKIILHLEPDTVRDMASDLQALASLDEEALTWALRLREPCLRWAYLGKRASQRSADLDALDDPQALRALDDTRLALTLRLRETQYSAWFSRCNILPRPSPASRPGAQPKTVRGHLADSLRTDSLPAQDAVALERAVALRGARLQALYARLSPEQRLGALREALDPAAGLAAGRAQDMGAALALRAEQIRVLSRPLGDEARRQALARTLDPGALAGVPQARRADARRLAGLHLQALFKLMTPAQREAALREALQRPVPSHPDADTRDCACYLQSVEIGMLAQLAPPALREQALAPLEDAEPLFALDRPAFEVAVRLRLGQLRAVYAVLPGDQRAARLATLRQPDTLAPLEGTPLQRTLDLRRQQYRALYSLLDPSRRNEALAQALDDLRPLQGPDCPPVDRLLLLRQQEVRALQLLGAG